MQWSLHFFQDLDYTYTANKSLFAGLIWQIRYYLLGKIQQISHYLPDYLANKWLFAGLNRQVEFELCSLS